MPQTPAGSPTLTAADCAESLLLLQREFDPTYGGFGRAPKFPPSMVLEALLRDGGEAAMLMAGRTLEAMARGGIYDQIGWRLRPLQRRRGMGGAALREDALRQRLAARRVRPLVASHAQPAGRARRHRDGGLAAAEMRTEQGAFAASLDADSKDDHGALREGAYYVWDRDQLLAALDEDDAAWAAEVFSVTPTGTFEHGASTLQLRSDHDQVRLADVRERLRVARDQRSRPGRDDKVVAAWNGWLVDSLVQAAMIFARPEWLADRDRGGRARLAVALARMVGYAGPRGMAQPGKHWAPGGLRSTCPCGGTAGSGARGAGLAGPRSSSCSR